MEFQGKPRTVNYSGELTTQPINTSTD